MLLNYIDKETIENSTYNWSESLYDLNNLATKMYDILFKRIRGKFHYKYPCFSFLGAEPVSRHNKKTCFGEHNGSRRSIQAPADAK